MPKESNKQERKRWYIALWLYIISLGFTPIVTIQYIIVTGNEIAGNIGGALLLVFLTSLIVYSLRQLIEK